MNMYDLKCPRCGKVLKRTNLQHSFSGTLCSNCKIRFDVKVTPDSRNTGKYTCTNIRSA